jgi:hypothetical protein
MSGQFHVMVAYPRGKRPRHPLDRKLSSSKAGLEAVKKRNISYPSWEPNSSSSVVQPIVNQYLLSCRGSYSTYKFASIVIIMSWYIMKL